MILITGATGRTGQAIVEKLKTTDLPVRVLVHQKNKIPLSGAWENIDIQVGDLSDMESLHPALVGVRTAYLLAPSSPQMVEYEMNFIKAAQAAGVEHIVKHSGFDARLNSPVNLLDWHGRSEQALQRSGIQWTLLQPHYFMQNLLGFSQSIKQDGLLRAPLGEASISMIDVRDIAAIAVAILRNPTPHQGHRYPLTGPQSLSFSEVAEHLSTVTGRTIRYLPTSLGEERFAMTEAGMPAWLVEALISLYASYRDKSMAQTYPWVEKVAGRPATDILTFLREHASAF